MEQEARAFFSSEGSLQDDLFNNLRDGNALPSWVKGCPKHKFELQLQDDSSRGCLIDVSELGAGWKSLLQQEIAAARREDRDPVFLVDTEPVVEAIFSSYADCKSKKITSMVFIALHVFRQ